MGFNWAFKDLKKNVVQDLQFLEKLEVFGTVHLLLGYE
jgi:hypothetical protein